MGKCSVNYMECMEFIFKSAVYIRKTLDLKYF